MSVVRQIGWQSSYNRSAPTRISDFEPVSGGDEIPPRLALLRCFVRGWPDFLEDRLLARWRVTVPSECGHQAARGGPPTRCCMLARMGDCMFAMAF